MKIGLPLLSFQPSAFSSSGYSLRAYLPQTSEDYATREGINGTTSFLSSYPGYSIFKSDIFDQGLLKMFLIGPGILHSFKCYSSI